MARRNSFPGAKSADQGTDVWPAAKQPIFHDLSYYMHEGGHGMVPSDWAIYIEFLQKAFRPDQ
jgi:hypothetical protein